MRNFLVNISVPAAAGFSGLLLLAAALLPLISNAKEPDPDKPTIVLVHGAFADSSSWNRVASNLLADGYPVVSASNPLRGPANDGSYVASLIDAIKGPIVLVGHSYGGIVISAAASGKSNVKALVYVAAFAPEAGESAFTLSEKFPGSTLGSALAPVPLSDGTHDLYIDKAKFTAQFAADVAESETKLMAATQRPVTDVALNELAGDPAWKSIPSWFIYGGQDKNIPAAVEVFMAKRAHAKETVEVERASHVVMISHPNRVVKLIEQAAAETCH